MGKRVVITGMGVVSPNGIGNEAFCRAVLAGKSGDGERGRSGTQDRRHKQGDGRREAAWAHGISSEEGLA